MRAEGVKVAFFGSTTLLAKEIRSILETRAFPVESVRLYDLRDEGAITEFAGEAMVVTRPDEETILDLDLAFLCGSPADMEAYLDWPARRGFVAIDLSGASLGRPGVPLVHDGINPADVELEGGCPAPLIGAPHAIAHNLASLLAAIRPTCDVVRMEALALRPVSDAGERGIDELHRQTVALLNFNSLPEEVFGHQIAFNVLPTSAVASGPREGFDARLHGEIVALVGLRDDQACVTSAFLPVFHGHTLSVTLDLAAEVDLTRLREALGSAHGLRLAEDPAGASPAGIAGEDSVAVFDVRAVAGSQRRAHLWAFCDNLKGGAAFNAVRIAERVADVRRVAG